jgi:hypothetical protein
MRLPDALLLNRKTECAWRTRLPDALLLKRMTEFRVRLKDARTGRIALETHDRVRLAIRTGPGDGGKKNNSEITDLWPMSWRHFHKFHSLKSKDFY